jgi:hypothetical protein
MLFKMTKSYFGSRAESRLTRFSPIALVAITALAASTTIARGQTLEELKSSELWADFSTSKNAPPSKRPKREHQRELLSNYDSMWSSRNGAEALLEWIGGRILGFNFERTHASRKDDCAESGATLKDRDGTRVYLSIVVPTPTYRDMAKLKTLHHINRFRPPALDVVAKQKIKIRGIEADYFRISGGSCSILIPIEQEGVVNLQVQKCTESQSMFEVANGLDIERLNLKLKS